MLFFVKTAGLGTQCSISRDFQDHVIDRSAFFQLPRGFTRPSKLAVNSFAVVIRGNFRKQCFLMAFHIRLCEMANTREGKERTRQVEKYFNIRWSRSCISPAKKMAW